MSNRNLKRSASAAALAFALAGYAGAAQAQVAAAPPPVRSSVDQNGVSLTSGSLSLTTTDVVIGQPTLGGLSYVRSFYGTGWRDNHTGTIKSASSKYTVSFGGGSGTFTLTGVLGTGTFASDQADGSSLTYNSTTQEFTYTTRDGTVAVFSKTLAETAPLEANEGKVVSITLPTGERTTYTYTSVTVSSVAYSRLSSVTNNLGYQLKFHYAANTTTDMTAWRELAQVTGLNNAVEYCDPTALTCTFADANWPKAIYASPSTGVRTVTDTLSRTTRYAYDAGGKLTGVRRPSASSDTTTIAYGTDGRVSSVSNGVATWTYDYDDSTTTEGYFGVGIHDPMSGHSYVFTYNSGSTTYTDQLSKSTFEQRDAYGRLTRVTSSDGDYVDYAYDGRGNVTTTTRVAKSGSGLSNIVTSATYPTTCTNVVVCNKPTTTTAANGAVTDYTYDATHGGLLTVTQPAPSTGAVRPQTRYTYTSGYAWAKDNTGVFVQAGTPVYRQSAISQCVSLASCANGADEVRVTTSYSNGNSTIGSNRVPTQLNRRSGDNVLTATTTTGWDDYGNIVNTNGPISGNADLIRYRYDAGRQLIGVITPDPDGAGALKFRATRYTYNADGQVTLTETGTVPSQTDTAWTSSFVTLQQATRTYDSVGRLAKTSLVAGGTTRTVTQYSYDSGSRLDCKVLRMNPLAFGSLPSSACELGTEGSDGPDRIRKFTYNAVGQVVGIHEAYGTTAQVSDVSVIYDSKGRILSSSDARGGLTTYDYDGFSRVKRVHYPDAATRTTSSSTDYEEYAYDAYGRLSQERRRDGSTFGQSYDLLNRLVTLDAPSSMSDITYTYDNLGRNLTTAQTGHTLTLAYDALGRVTSRSGPLGTLSYEYDITGRRTKITWPDANYVTYEYDVAGAMTTVKESGSTTLATYAYDDLGRRASLTRGNGVVTTYTFDTASRLTGLGLNLSGAANDQSWTYTYNADGQRLTSVGSNTAYAPGVPATGTRSYGSNGLNQLTSSGSLTLTSDSKGNLNSDGINSYSYDAANRLTGMSGVTLSYDPDGRLYETVGSTTTRFAYDGVDLVGEYNASGALLRRYVPGAGVDEPLVWYEGSGLTDRRYLVADQLGSIAAVTDNAGAPLGINTYNEYGVPGSGNIGRFQYTGQTFVPEAGLYYYKARVYSASLGRFNQPDPIGYADGMNVYAYVGNDPINFTDPTGRFGDDGRLPFGIGNPMASEEQRRIEIQIGNHRYWILLEVPEGLGDAVRSLGDADWGKVGKKAVNGGVGGAVGGAVVGCAATAAAGCVEGAIPAAGLGALGGFVGGGVTEYMDQKNK